MPISRNNRKHYEKYVEKNRETLFTFKLQSTELLSFLRIFSQKRKYSKGQIREMK